MRITDTNLKEFIEETYVFEHGSYYFFKDFIVSEVNEGVDYNWDIAQEIIEIATKYYGKKQSVCLISNRVNRYSINPLGWHNFFKSGKRLNGLAIVSYSDKSWANAAIEKLFFNSILERFNNIFEAVQWAKEINSKNEISLKKK